MKYMGSKSRIAGQIVPIMLAEAQRRGLKSWVEPFVGGANTIDKVPNSFARVGCDVNPHTIAALSAIRDMAHELPDDFTEAEYRAVQYKAAPAPVTSLARFGASFGGRFDEGFARGKRPDGTPRNYWQETKRNAIKQAPSLQGVVLKCCGYRELDVTESLVYCDPPYQGTKEYRSGLVPKMDYPAFWQWCRDMAQRGNVVFVSEYAAPDGFECVWSGEVKTNFASTRTEASSVATERLFLAL